LINTIREAARPFVGRSGSARPPDCKARGLDDDQASQLGLIHGFLSNSPDCFGKRRVVDRQAVLQQRSSPP
jgi:hypothetical protein